MIAASRSPSGRTRPGPGHRRCFLPCPLQHVTRSANRSTFFGLNVQHLLAVLVVMPTEDRMTLLRALYAQHGAPCWPTPKDSPRPRPGRGHRAGDVPARLAPPAASCSPTTARYARGCCRSPVVCSSTLPGRASARRPPRPSLSPPSAAAWTSSRPRRAGRRAAATLAGAPEIVDRNVYSARRRTDRRALGVRPAPRDRGLHYALNQLRRQLESARPRPPARFTSICSPAVPGQPTLGVKPCPRPSRPHLRPSRWIARARRVASSPSRSIQSSTCPAARRDRRSSATASRPIAARWCHFLLRPMTAGVVLAACIAAAPRSPTCSAARPDCRPTTTTSATGPARSAPPR